MKVLVTGCAGFIGSHITELLLEHGNAVIGIDNFDAFYSKDQKLKNLSVANKNKNFEFIEADIVDAKTFSKLNGIDFVIHLAAKAGVRPSILKPQDYIDTNLTGTLNILEWMRQNHIGKMIFGSSSSIYGNNKKVPFSENDFVDEPISPYAFTKKSAELLNYTYHHLYNISIVNLRFFTVYGPRQRPDLAIRKFVDNILHSKPVHLYGDGSTARDYTYVSDICNGILSTFNYINSNKPVYNTINIGNSSPVKLLELVNTIYGVLNKKPDLVFEPMQPGDVDITYADINKAKKLLNYAPSTSLKDGISKFVDWYKESIK